jgi:Reverse transcriptase (RNA-dependent DNA polymerase)/RNase H-like domain found in reverse transcriptase/Integrase zinc binding domain/Chromo (CHRromatin Organisation MOdifier) domain/Aspartyl protease
MVPNHPNVTEFGGAEKAALHAESCDRSILPAIIQDIARMTDQKFTIDAFADSSHTSVCTEFFSPDNSFLQAGIHSGHVWCHAPYHMLHEYIGHYLQHKLLHPNALSACFLVPTTAATKSLKPWLQRMQLLQVYPKGTILFRQHKPDGSLTVMPPCPYDVSIYWDKPRPSMAALTASSTMATATDTHASGNTLDMMFAGSVSGAKADVLISDSKVLIDSGATGPFISPAFAHRLGLKIRRDTTTSIALADGTTVLSHGSCKATIALGPFRCKVELTVTPLATHYDIILGNSWLRQYKAILSYKDGTLTLFKGNRKFTLGHKHVAADNIPPLPDIIPTTELPDARDAFAKKHCISAMQVKRAIKQGLRHFLVTLEELTNTDESLNMMETSGDPILADLLHRYKDRFPDELPALDANPGTPHLYSDHTIPLEPGHKPPVRPIYRLSPLEFAELKKQIKQLLALGFIEPSSSSYAAPVLFVQKKDGSLRMCIDYRALNKITIKNKYPLPRIDDILDKLNGSAYFSSIDLKSGYHQLRIAEQDVKKTAFRTPLGLYAWRVLPFGLCNSPATWQNAMNDIFRQHLDEFVVVYLDDILIFSKSKEDHYKHVETVLNKLRAHGLYANAKKCAFFKPELEFLGHIIGTHGIKVDPKKTKVINSWPKPTNVTDLRSFLGLANYFRRFIQGYSSMVAPLTDLLAKTKSLTDWGPECDQAFNAVKHTLSNAPVLAHPDFTRPFHVICDASMHGVGAVLLQDNRPVAFLSRKFCKAEYNYTTTEQELLAAVECLKQWRCYLEGVEFTLWTDHNPNTYMHTKALLSRREARWSEMFQHFRFTWKHKPGLQNMADAISRLPQFRQDNDILPGPPGVNLANQPNLLPGQTMNSFFTAICNAMQLRPRYKMHPNKPTTASKPTVATRTPARKRPASELTPSGSTEVKAGYSTDDWFKNNRNTKTLTHRDGLWWKGDQLVIPDAGTIRKDLMHDAHDSKYSGHIGGDKTISHLLRSYWWPHLRNDVRTYVAECDSCQRNKSVNKAKAGLLQPLPVPDTPWTTMTMDLITDLPETDDGYDSVAVFVDKLTKMTHIAPCKKTINSQQFAELYLQHVVRLHGFQLIIISDRDPRWNSDFWKAVCRQFNTKLCFSTAFHPETDGQTERMNRTLEEMMRHYVAPHHADWDKHLPMVEFAINNAIQISTKQTPFYMHTGIHPLTPLSSLRDTNNAEATRVTTTWQARVQKATANLQAAQDRQRQFANSKRRDVTFNVGDKILLNSKNINIKHSGSRKLLPRYIGPFEITQKIGQVAYKLQLPLNMKCHNVFHVSLLQTYTRSGRHQPPPPPLVIDGAYEYEVHHILDHNGHKPGKRRFLVAWKGYPAEHNTWEPEANLTNCSEDLAEYWAKHPAA